MDTSVTRLSAVTFSSHGMKRSSETHDEYSSHDTKVVTDSTSTSTSDAATNQCVRYVKS